MTASVEAIQPSERPHRSRRTPPDQRRTSNPGDASPQGATALDSHLAELERQLNELRSQVRQAQQLSSLGTVTAVIAHEYNNLLTPIVSYAKAALESDDPALQRKALVVTIRNAEMLAAMSDRVLSIGAAKAPKREPVNVRKCADDAHASLCRDLARDGITFRNDAPEELSVLADGLQLRQVLFNLLLNAREAMASHHGGRLTVEAERLGDRVCIRVRNTGAPIDPALLPHVFDPLQSSKTARDTTSRCSGLGLSLCRDLIEENEGEITVESDATGGTRFSIELAAAPALVSTPAGSGEP